MPRLIIFVNGMLPELESARNIIQAGDVLIAADGGTRHALAMGLSPSIVIGDLDSLTPDDRRQLDARGVKIQQYPRDKAETDLELALQYAFINGFREIRILGGLGGRLDQTLANLSLLTDPEFNGLDIRIDDGVEEAFFVRDRCELHGKPAEVVSLIPWGSQVGGVCTDGLRWPLQGETLFPDKTRGISNEMARETARISLESGLLLVVHHRQV
jgi:thiamine pyrophosphokinase